MSTRIALLGSAIGIALCPLGWLCSGARASADVRWRSVPTHAAELGLDSVAFDPVRGRIAVGSPRGVFAGDLAGVFDLVPIGGGVRDLVYFASTRTAPVLLAGTPRGVYRIAAGEVVGPVVPSPGARSVVRIAVPQRGAGIALATEAGAFFSRDGRRWSRLSPSHPSGPVAAIALRAREPNGRGLECFTWVRGALWRTVITAPGAGDVARSRRVTIPFAPSESALDVVAGLPGRAVAVLFASALAVRRDGEAGATWEILRPTLPPGARITRVAAALGRIWLGTDRGLLEALRLEGPWRRAAAPAGSAAVRALAGDAETLYVASETRLLHARRARVDRAAAAPGPPAERASGEPSIAALHRAAIEHLSLSRDRLESLQSRVGRRGWLPVVSIRGDYDRDEERGIDYDQVFSSGSLHNLIDRADDRSVDTGVSVTLAWDFGDVVYHPEEIDVSRELRSLLALRDDVLDELTQLYFDRQRVLARRAALPPGSAEALDLQIRADELAAGMDAWTGGWFSRARRLPAHGAPPHVLSPRQRNSILEEDQ